MTDSDEYVVIGSEAFFSLVNGDSVIEYFDSSDLQSIAENLLQELGNQRPIQVRMVSRGSDEIMIVPSSSIVTCHVRHRYQMEDDGQGGERRVKKSQ